MGALSDLLKQTPTVANPANLRINHSQPSVADCDSQDSQDSQGATPDMRAHLLTLADAQRHAPAIVHRLHADDIAACVGLPDESLRAYLRALDRGTDMDRGIAPGGYTQASHCDGCGPVWLWQGAPARLVACPWCFRRKAVKALPRPQVACGDCIRYLPDPLNPHAGIGVCALGAGRAHWPMKRHQCGDHAPIDNRPEQGDSLMTSHSVEAQP